MPDHASSVLPAMDIAGRIDRLRTCFDGAGIDALVITNARNIRYLTGFTGSAGHLVVTDGDAVLVTDGRYESQAPEQLAASGANARVEITTVEQRAVTAAVVQGLARIGLEALSITWSQQRAFASEWFPAHELVATESLVEALRTIKDDGEVARIRAAASIADEALAALRHRLTDGGTEREFALELDTEMRRRGATERAFETIVAAGPNAAKPHARPGERRIRSGDLVIVDFGAVVDGYRSDMTRTFMIGEPSAEQERLLDVVTDAQQAGVAAVAVGADVNAVDAAARGVIEQAGWAERFVHGTGHGVGPDIHEAPWVNARSAATLAAGHVITVEPGVYLPELGGVRVEDTIFVTDDGPRQLTGAPKQPYLS